MASLAHLGCKDHLEKLANLVKRVQKATEASLVCKDCQGPLVHQERRVHQEPLESMASLEPLVQEDHLALTEQLDLRVWLVPLVLEEHLVMKEREDPLASLDLQVLPAHLENPWDMMLRRYLPCLAKEHQRVRIR